MGYVPKRFFALSRQNARALTAASLGLSIGAAGALAQESPKSDQPDAPPPSDPGFIAPTPNRGAQPPARPADPVDHGANPADPEAPAYLVGAFVIRYALDHPSLPAIDDLLKKEVTLGKTDAGYVAPGGGVAEETITIEDVSLQPPTRWSSRALYQVSKAILEEMNAGGVIGVTVTPIEAEFGQPSEGDPRWGKDMRKPGQSAVTLLVKVGLVTEMRTIAFGDRIPFDNRINAPEHKRILENSPVQVFRPDDAERYDVLRKDELDEYVFRLNRHPGRRVDLAVAAAQDPGGIALDLLINENKPWLAYFQVSNTGTKSTSEWRERFGFTHNQLTGDDDILSLDYITAGFTESHAIVASYERPVWGDTIRGKVFASYNQFTATDVGLAGEVFNGDGFSIGGELIANIFQRRELFVDAVIGARYQHVSADDETVMVSGSADFFITTFGLRAQRNTDTSITSLSAAFEVNLPDIAGTNDEDLQKLPGRLKTDAEFTTFQWDLSHAFYLDPLIFGSSWNDTSVEGNASLAHEIVLSFRGQHAFNNRLIPNFEQVVGGIYTVRGYPESVVAGDTVLVASAEYRLHVPQAFGYDPNPGELFGQQFRFQPQQPYGRADWDFIVKGFLDAGKTINSKRETFERDESLAGAGFGFEFMFRRNFSLRFDCGWALQDVERGDKAVTSGSNRLHFVATVLF